MEPTTGSRRISRIHSGAGTPDRSSRSLLITSMIV
jgi:hypothetical protein